MKIWKVLLVVLTLGTTSCEHIEMAQPQHMEEYTADWEMWPIDTDWQLGNEVIQFINEYRISKGMDLLTKDTGLPSALASQHSNYMIYTQQLSHDGFADRAEIMHNNGAAATAENVAFGYKDAWEIVEAWKKSPAHLDALEGNYTHIGLGIRTDVLGTTWVTMLAFRK